jgi:hypothetical protein
MCRWTGSPLDWGNTESDDGKWLRTTLGGHTAWLRTARLAAGWRMSDEGWRHGAAGDRTGLLGGWRTRTGRGIDELQGRVMIVALSRCTMFACP